MNVKKLMDALAQYPGDMEVIMSKDGEGNKYRPLDSYSDELMILTRDRGHISEIEPVSDECDEDCTDECAGDHSERESGVKVICLWPTY